MATSTQLFEKFYSFPPFYTLQPTPSTRSKQLELWTKLLQSHCQESRQFVLTRSESIFTNVEIKRSLSNDFITDMFSYMIDNDHAIPHVMTGGGSSSPHTGGNNKGSVRRGHVQSGAGVDSVVIWFIPRDKWYEKLYDYARKNGLQNGGIATAFEILEDDEFKGMDSMVLGILLRGMQEALRKCEVMIGDAGDVEGVKFF